MKRNWSTTNTLADILFRLAVEVVGVLGALDRLVCRVVPRHHSVAKHRAMLNCPAVAAITLTRRGDECTRSAYGQV